MKRIIHRTAESATPSQSATDDLDAVYAKIARRIIPFMVLLFLTRMPTILSLMSRRGVELRHDVENGFIDVLP